MWLGIEEATGQQYAMKQFPKSSGKFDSSAGVEIQVQKILQDAVKRGA